MRRMPANLASLRRTISRSATDIPSLAAPLALRTFSVAVRPVKVEPLQVAECLDAGVAFESRAEATARRFFATGPPGVRSHGYVLVPLAHGQAARMLDAHG